MTRARRAPLRLALRAPLRNARRATPPRGVSFQPAPRGQISSGLDIQQPEQGRELDAWPSTDSPMDPTRAAEWVGPVPRPARRPASVLSRYPIDRRRFKRLPMRSDTPAVQSCHTPTFIDAVRLRLVRFAPSSA